MNGDCKQPDSDGEHLRRFRKSPVAIRPILRDAYTGWCGEAKKKGLSFRAVSPDVVVSTHPFWIGVIASLLIGNAIEHTDTGGVSVDFSRHDGRWILTVQDSRPEVSASRPHVRGAEVGYGLRLVKQAAALLANIARCALILTCH
jgi:signal transduction histidine kinase